MTGRSNTPMELNVTGQTIRRAFALVIHDSLWREANPRLETLGSLSVEELP